MSENIEVLVNNAADLAEGPYWDAATQCLYYVDTFGGAIYRYNCVTNEKSRLDFGDATMGIVIPRQKGGFVVSRQTDIVLLETWDSADVKPLAKLEESDTMMLNDGKVDSSGRLWIGSCFCGKGIPDPNDWPKGLGSLYSVDASGGFKKHKENITISNGMDWNDTYNIMYYTDSLARQIWAFDFDVTSGTISNQRTLADFRGTTIEDMGYPDGLTVDEEGKIWLASCGGGKVVRIDQETGQVIRTVKFPTERITSCCFGGKDYSDLYVTSLKSPHDKVKATLAGSIFKVTGLGVKGRNPNLFAG